MKLRERTRLKSYGTYCGIKVGAHSAEEIMLLTPKESSFQIAVFIEEGNDEDLFLCHQGIEREGTDYFHAALQLAKHLSRCLSIIPEGVDLGEVDHWDEYNQEWDRLARVKRAKQVELDQTVLVRKRLIEQEMDDLDKKMEAIKDKLCW